MSTNDYFTRPFNDYFGYWPPGGYWPAPSVCPGCGRCNYCGRPAPFRVEPIQPIAPWLTTPYTPPFVTTSGNAIDNISSTVVVH